MLELCYVVGGILLAMSGMLFVQTVQLSKGSIKRFFINLFR